MSQVHSYNGLPFRIAAAAGFSLLALSISGCSPTVRVEAPKDPITINLNVKLDADVRLRVEQQAKDDVTNNPIF